MTHCLLPEPAASAAAHSQAVIAHINKKIRAMAGCLPFDQYLHEVLYAPGLGYYSAGSVKFGQAGDFVTAPELSPLFGTTLAASLAPYLREHPDATLLELGPGSGKLAVDILRALAERDALPARYALLEVSADLRARQQVYLSEHLPPAVFARCHWLDRLPQQLHGIVLANEVLDALAVSIFQIKESGSGELCVEMGDDETCQTTFNVPSSLTLGLRIEALRERYQLPKGYQSELNLRQEALLHSLAEMLHTGLMLFIDYGFSGATYYHPERTRGTLQCHYRHHNHDDPFYLPGLQDITSHVDFTALATCGLQAGLELSLYCHQADFLMEHGILTHAVSVGSDALLIKQSQGLQKLLMPHEMGELFKVMIFHKNCLNPFASDSDRRHTL